MSKTLSLPHIYIPEKKEIKTYKKTIFSIATRDEKNEKPFFAKEKSS